MVENLRRLWTSNVWYDDEKQVMEKAGTREEN
jgi:hypothetical protein